MLVWWLVVLDNKEKKCNLTLLLTTSCTTMQLNSFYALIGTRKTRNKKDWGS